MAASSPCSFRLRKFFLAAFCSFIFASSFNFFHFICTDAAKPQRKNTRTAANPRANPRATPYNKNKYSTRSGVSTQASSSINPQATTGFPLLQATFTSTCGRSKQQQQTADRQTDTSSFCCMHALFYNSFAAAAAPEERGQPQVLLHV